MHFKKKYNKIGCILFQVDFQTCLDNGVITRDMKPICPVDGCGRFNEEITDFCGQYVKDADKNICKYLKVSGIYDEIS